MIAVVVGFEGVVGEGGGGGREDGMVAVVEVFWEGWAGRWDGALQELRRSMWGVCGSGC